MDTRSRAIRSLAATRSAAFDLCLLTAGATLVLLQAFRVFMPYLVFEVDQSERGRLATIAFTVFALTLLGALLFRLFHARVTLAIAVATLAIGRLGFQFTEDAGARWRLAAMTIVACLWLLIVILPQGEWSSGIGIGFALLVDLIVRCLRGTLDLPWMPGVAQDLLTIAIVGAIAYVAFACVRSDVVSEMELSFVASARFIGLGSGIALWLVAAGNPGFAELRSGWGLPGAFALLAIGTVLALVWEAGRMVGDLSDRNDRLVAAGIALLGTIAVEVWWNGATRWLELLGVPVFSFAVVSLSMRCATAPGSPNIPGRWRTGAAVTIGVLLQAAFLFLYFARTGPIELYLIPLAILTAAAVTATPSLNVSLPTRQTFVRATGTAAIVAALTFGWLLLEEPSHSGTAAESADLTVMTFNIQEGFSNENTWSLETVARTIESYDPDIVVLQETTRGWLVMSSVDQIRWLADRLKMDYAYAGNSHDELWGNTILSRLPIVSTDWVTFSTTENLRRSALSVEVETANGPLRVIDTHLDNPVEATEVRLQQIDELIELWGGSTPAMVAGDFNADPGSLEWQAMIDAGFVDTGSSSNETTSEDERRIDYIFVTPDLQVENFTVPEVWVSDHRPVLVDISMPP
jgi:endonuclease/exonuclease/phosphatase family metal-dependent hydrolase